MALPSDLPNKVFVIDGIPIIQSTTSNQDRPSYMLKSSSQDSRDAIRKLVRYPRTPIVPLKTPGETL